MGGLSWWHWLVIGGAFILLFGAKKLPDAAQGLGRSLRILKSEVSAMNDDGAAAPTGSMTSSVNAPARAQRLSSSSHSGGTTPHHPPPSQPVRARSGQG